MKKTLLNFLGRLLSLTIVSAVLVISFGGVLAPGQNVRAAETPCDATSKNGTAIPDTFSVGDCLTIDEQRGSTFVPAKELAPGEPGPAQAGASGSATNPIVLVLIRIIDMFVKWVGSIALIIFMIGALLTITSEGREDRLEKGKSAMLFALIGVAIAMASFLFVTFVQSLFFSS
ncbi:hypothetical protein CO046_04495 [Candidatus Peregrinibacteria bacterium CG_4_9_14_0_2_um_filter_53_11]|nr:MAG: hypothetical protein CO046_04495 [Candidatus Peregrinibacteria bacterium CG_4_9_14_0_2_um_filter_53_11]